MSFIDKSLTSDHMKKSKCRNSYLKNKTDTTGITYIMKLQLLEES